MSDAIDLTPAVLDTTITSMQTEKRCHVCGYTRLLTDEPIDLPLHEIAVVYRNEIGIRIEDECRDCERVLRRDLVGTLHRSPLGDEGTLILDDPTVFNVGILNTA